MRAVHVKALFPKVGASRRYALISITMIAAPARKQINARLHWAWRGASISGMDATGLAGLLMSGGAYALADDQDQETNHGTIGCL